MKKFFIPLILLFGFFVFVPQVAMGDLIWRPKQPYPNYDKIKQEREDAAEKSAIENHKDYECLSDKKTKLSQKYEGPDLVIKLDNIGIGYLAPKYHRRKTWTGNRYFIDQKTFDKKPCNKTEPWKNHFVQDLKNYEEGFYDKCHEYIKFNKKQDADFGELTTFFVDVTDVPPNSYLKYMPKSKTFKVISPVDKNYETIMKKHKEDLEDEKYCGRLIKISPKQQKKLDKRAKKYKSCLKEIKEKKLKAAQEYLSKNIELKHCKKCAETGYLNSMFSSIFKKARGANTDNQYFIYVETPKKEDVVVSDLLYFNCHEYIGIKDNSDFYVADITEVPQNSFLQYLPESKMLKVISPNDKNYETVYQRHKEKYLTLMNITHYGKSTAFIGDGI